MGKVLTDSKHYSDIANAIREAGPFVDDTFKPADMAEKITNSIAYNYNTGATEGYSQGRTDGYTEGYEKGKAEGGDGDTEAAYNEGKKDEYDRFWDAYQQNGTRTDYNYAFQKGWTDENFQPKYDIAPIGYALSVTFQYTLITDLKDKLEALGIKLDTSACTSFLQAFQGAEITHIPELDLRMANSLGYTFGSACKVVTIDKLIVSETTPFQNSTFDTAKDLQNITFEGTIGVSINFQWSPLTRQSIESVMAALSENTHDLTATFQKTAVEAAFTTQEWNDLTATRTNWNIALV